MEYIKQYLLSVISASIICALAMRISGKNKLQSAVIKLLAGVFLSITVIAPWTYIRLQDVTSYFSSMQTDADRIAAQGNEYASNEIISIITQETEAYILDKASVLGLSIKAEIVLNECEPFAPRAVTIYGSASPYAKLRLEQIIENDLGIQKENQVWS